MLNQRGSSKDRRSFEEKKNPLPRGRGQGDGDKSKNVLNQLRSKKEHGNPHIKIIPFVP